MKYLVIVAALFLSGCEIIVANSIQDYHDVRSLTRAYIAENVMVRREIRRRCLSLVMREVDQLVEEKKYTDALAVLDKAYPPLVTSDLIDQGAVALDDAPTCG